MKIQNMPFPLRRSIPLRRSPLDKASLWEWTPLESPFGEGPYRKAWGGKAKMAFPKGSLWGGQSKNGLGQTKHGFGQSKYGLGKTKHTLPEGILQCQGHPFGEESIGPSPKGCLWHGAGRVNMLFPGNPLDR